MLADNSLSEARQELKEVKDALTSAGQEKAKLEGKFEIIEAHLIKSSARIDELNLSHAKISHNWQRSKDEVEEKYKVILSLKDTIAQLKQVE